MGFVVYTKKIWSWALYDFANTAFSALFVTFFYPLYVKEFLGGNEFQIGLVFGLSMLLVGLFVPLLGTIADVTGRRVRIVSIFTLLCIVTTALVPLVGLKLALFLGFLANFFYHACLVTYNSILPQLTKEEKQGSVSGFGVGIGYLGTFASLGIAALILQSFGWESKLGIKLIFPATALFFLGFSLFLFFNVPDQATKKQRKIGILLRHSTQELFTTLRRFHRYPGLLPYLLSSFMYANATTSAIVFLFLYARNQIQMTVQTFTLIFVLFAIASALGSFLAGYLTDRKGPRWMLVAAGIVWSLVIVLLLQPTGIGTFIVAGMIGGAGLGSIWTANRPMLLRLAPKMKPGEFFGFNELSEKLSGSVGPIVFGYLAVAYGYTIAIGSLLLFFAFGLMLLGFVPNGRKT